MTVSSAFGRALILVLTALCWTGCSPLSNRETDDEKNPHFQAGRNRMTQMDYTGAIQSFEKALEANPQSAAAHLELGLLYEQRMNDFAAAIFHFDKHLRLKPDSHMAQTVRDRIISCKIELAKTVPFALVSQQVQAGLDRLTSENATLHQQIDQLKAQLAAQTAQLASRPAVPIETPASSPPATPLVERANVPPSRPAPLVPTNAVARIVTPAKSHVVRPGETMARIARNYSITLPALQAANPGVEPRRLRNGQTLQIPAPKR